MTEAPSPIPVPGIVDLHPRLQAGETLFGTFAGLGSPVATELIGRAGFDWVIIDLEHGAGTESDLLANLHALGATTTAALVRPQSGERLRIGRALDLGAHGIMVPRVDRPDQAREAVSFMRYPPDGGRGLALSTRGAGLGALGHTDIQAINRRILGIIQIESPSAVEHAPEIAAIDGVDVLFVGPTDLSHSLGVPGRFDDRWLSRRPRTGDDGGRGRRQGGRDPVAERVRPAPPPRPRLPVHRPRLRRGVHQRRSAGRAGRRPDLTRPAAAARSPRRRPLFVGDAHRQRRRPLGRRPGLGHHDPDEDQRAAHELDGVRATWNRIAARAIVQIGSAVAISDACAAPTRRAPA